MRQLRGILAVLAISSLAGAGVLAATALAAAPLKPGQTCVAKKQPTYKQAGLTCVRGKLKKLAARPMPPTTTVETGTTPTTPTTLVAAVGHYEGRTNQGSRIAFDVQPDVKNLTLVIGGAIDQRCASGAAWQFTGFETGGYDYPMGTTSIWHLPTPAGSKGVTSSGIAWSTQIKMDATWSDATHVTGNYSIHTFFAASTDTCDTAVTFSAAHA